jgi:hypothetical protein
MGSPICAPSQSRIAVAGRQRDNCQYDSLRTGFGRAWERACASRARRRQLEHRLGADQAGRGRDLWPAVGRFAMHERGRLAARHGCAPRISPSGLRSFSRHGIRRITQELARDRDTTDPAHDIGLAEAIVGSELEQHFGRADSRRSSTRTRNSVARSIETRRSISALSGNPRVEADRGAGSAHATCRRRRRRSSGLAQRRRRLATELLDRGHSAEMAAGHQARTAACIRPISV